MTLLKKCYRRLFSYWMAFAHVLGRVNSVIILTFLFYVLFGLYAVPMRTYRALRSFFVRKVVCESYWVDKKERPATLEELKRQF